MSTATLEAHHKLSSQLSAESVDAARGILRAATVMKSGIQATGKFVMLDAKGEITRDPEEMASEVPVFTDETTLLTLMSAAKAAGKRIKTREDHVDSVGARAGYADAFTLTDDGRVTADIHLLKTYENRELVLETALETPEEIGLSIDFTPEFELRDGKALMRVQELHAVDVVDEGAATPGGLFLSASVDTTPKVESAKISPPAKMATQTPDEIMSAIGKLSEAVGTLTKTVGEMQAKMSATPTAPAAATEALKATKEEVLKLAAEETKNQVAAAMKEEAVKLKRERQAMRLGYSAADQLPPKLANASPEELEKIEKEKPKDYLGLVADRVAAEKCKRSSAHEWVMKNHKSEYEAHLAATGVIRLQAA